MTMQEPPVTPVGRPDTAASHAFGRYALRRLVADTDLAHVWLGSDPHTGRDVRIKLVKPGPDVDAAQMASWVHKANQRSHLAHPAILPLQEVGVLHGQPFLVSGWVAGQTLADRMATSAAAVSARRASGWMLEVLDALVLAHAAGQVHGRLHPGNILIDEQGRARLLDFAVPVRVTDPAAAAAQARALAPWWPSGQRMAADNDADADLHAVGMVLACLLSGRRITPGAAAATAEPGAAGWPAGSDPDLRAIVQAVLAPEAGAPRSSARDFHDTLARWSHAAAGLASSSDRAAPGHSSASDGALERLLKRMQQNEDFPAMSHAVSRIQAMVASDTESVGAVADEILKDVALSNKLLRIVNSAYYARGGGIATISRAVTLIGFNGVRNMAMGLVLLEGMQDKAHAQILTEEFVRALLAASIAREIASAGGNGEEAFIGAMFQDLGRLLAMYYFPLEAQQVRQLLRDGAGKLNESSASIRVLGLDYEALGLGVAKLWDLPADIRRYMHQPVGGPPQRVAADTLEQMRWTTLAANRLADIWLKVEPAEQAGRLDAVRKLFARALDCTPDAIRDAMEQARRKLIDLAALMELQITPGSAAEQLLRPLAPDRPQADEVAMPAGPQMPALEAAIAAGRPLFDKLTAGLADVDRARASGIALPDLLQLVIDVLYRSTGVSHVLFCLRDAHTGSLTARLGRGDGIDAIVRGFQVTLTADGSDLFQAVCMRGADMVIGDIRVARVSERLPSWYRKLIQPQAQSMLLLPLKLGDRPIALIYAHTQGNRTLSVSDKEIALLRQLRDRVLSALRPPR